MNEPKNFISRWSERKLKPETEKPAPDEKDNVPAEAAKPAETSPASVVEFDISTLPTLESITANSDIRVFLQRGVPAELTRAALRRAWSTDPAIRDFIGLSENAWDFNKPESIYGFGSFSAEEAKEAAAQFFRGQLRKAQDPPTPEVADKRGEPPPEEATKPQSDAVATAQPVESEIAQEEVQNVALQQDEPINSARPVRRHGGALPK